MNIRSPETMNHGNLPAPLLEIVWVTVMFNRTKNAERIERQIKRFEKSAWRRLRKLAGLSPRLADLIESFPAAAYVLATSQVPPEASGETVRRVKNGESLKDAVQPLGLPMWLKRVPPEAFSGAIVGAPDGEKFARQIAGRIPEDPGLAWNWLAWVCFAGRAGDADFALWIAGQKRPFPRPLHGQCNPLRPLAAFAWVSRHDHGLAREFIDKPWQPSMRFEKSVTAMQIWLDRVAQEFRPKRPRRGPGRYSQRDPAGLRMVPLRTGPQLRDEGRAMNHCVGTYAHMVAHGECLIFSVRDGERRFATVELRRKGRNGPYVVAQLQGPGNSRVSEAVWHFVQGWTKRFEADPGLAFGSGESGFKIREAAWQDLFGAYNAAKCDNALTAAPQTLEQLLLEAELLRELR